MRELLFQLLAENGRKRNRGVHEQDLSKIRRSADSNSNWPFTCTSNAADQADGKSKMFSSTTDDPLSSNYQSSPLKLCTIV